MNTWARVIQREVNSIPDRLLVGVLGNRHAGKSHTWNTLFGRTVRRGIRPHRLVLRPGECVEVFLVSGSFEERREYAGRVLRNQRSRIVLCSMQYTNEVHRTLDYFIDHNFYLYIHWLNPGYHDAGETWDRLGLTEQILAHNSLFVVRNGQGNATSRVGEMRQFIYGWARYRNLIVAC
jgi:hypothetical protein